MFTVAGALTQALPAIGVVLDLEGGRPLPVAVRELTTLDHLASSELVVLLHIDPASAPSRIAEAVRLLNAMWTQEVTTIHGDHWVLDEAPNRPQPLHPGMINIMLLVEELTMLVAQQAAELEMEAMVVGSSPRDGRERWIWLDDEEIGSLLAENEGARGGRSTS